MALLNKEIFEEKFKNGVYSPLINLMLQEKVRQSETFSYYDIYIELNDKLKEYDMKLSFKVLNELTDCLNIQMAEGNLKEVAGLYYPTKSN